MEAKKVYQISLVFCGLFLALSGIACLVVATLLNHDSDLSVIHESSSRTYATQYWLGIPIIAFGGIMMIISPSMHRRKIMASLSLLSCIPLITCALAGSILHGTAYTHFLSIREHRLFLEERSYLCADNIQDDSTQCKCTKTEFNRETSSELLPVPCAQQRSLIGFHGALLTFSAVTFSLLLGILVICVILLPQFLKLQLSIGDAVASGQVSEGCSHVSSHSIDVHNDTPLSQLASQTTLTTNDRPPSYESLLTSFNTTPHSMAPRNSTSHDTIETNNVGTERNIAATVNRQARVRYRGELNSNQIPRRTDQGESSANNELPPPNRLENIGPASPHRGLIPLNRPGGAIPRRASQNRQGSHELHLTTNSENRRIMPNETSRQQRALNDTNEPRSEQISEPSIETRSRRNTPPSLEASSEIGTGEVKNSSDVRTRNTTSSAEHPSNNPRHSFTQLFTDLQTCHSTFTDVTVTHVTHTERPPAMEVEGEVVRNIRISSPSTDNSNDTVRHDSTFMDHTPLGRTVSDNSEDGVYIDITRNAAHRSNCIPTGDSHVAVRYRGQINSENSVQPQSSETHEQENNTKEDAVEENLQETTHQDNISWNSVDTGTSAQTADYLHNGSAETASGNIDISIQDQKSSNGNAPRTEGESLSSEMDVATNDADTNSVSSLEIMSI